MGAESTTESAGLNVTAQQMPAVVTPQLLSQLNRQHSRMYKREVPQDDRDYVLVYAIFSFLLLLLGKLEFAKCIILLAYNSNAALADLSANPPIISSRHCGIIILVLFQSASPKAKRITRLIFNSEEPIVL